jgi:DedD protein
MNDGFRQRLVGAVVLTCLALILWPIIFSESSRPLVDRRSQIPPMPQFEKYSVPAPKKPANVEPVTTNVQIDSPSKAAVIQKTSKTGQAARKQDIKLDQRGLPEPWVLQVASFSQEKNADTLVAKLKKNGYKAFFTSEKNKEKTLSRVFVGPKFKKTELDKMRKEIDKTYKVKSLIVRYEP